MKRLCVFCGSSPGIQPEYAAAARELGYLLAERGIGLVYGGAGIGIMGLVAAAVLEGGGNVTGVIPRALAEKEVAFTRLPDLRIVDSMHERKALMADMSDGFIAMPGGLGTIEEFIEVVTWGQLDIHRKPCGLLNICGYFDQLLSFLNHVVGQQFMEPEHRDMIIVDEKPARLLDCYENYEAPTLDKAAWAIARNKEIKK